MATPHQVDQEACRRAGRRGGVGRGVALVLCLALVVGCAGRRKPPQTLDDQARQLNVSSFEFVWQTVRDKHWDPELGGLDWEAVREELRPRVAEAGSMDRARGVMNEMLQRLGQSHFGILPADVRDAVAPTTEDQQASGDGVTGIRVRVVDGRALVFEVADESPAALAGVVRGWQVDAIEGQKLDELLERVHDAYAEDTTLDLFSAMAVGDRLSGPIGGTRSVEFVDGDDKQRTLELSLEQPDGKLTSFGNLPPTYVRYDSSRVDGNVGYIRFNIFLNPPYLMSSFGETVQSLDDAPGLIIDLRGNPGGIGGMAMGMAGWLIGERDLKLGTMHTRQSALNFVIIPRASTFDRPVALLVDGLTASTSEILSGGLQDLERARVFGTRTAGAALPSVIERLPNGDGFQYAFANYISDGGETLEGVGVLPDERVEFTQRDLLQGRDPVLEAAVTWILRQ
ncbi:MAG: hypothetical protein GY716_15420 [bacterium]|nr:hypothetical protein [bacterium]